MKKIQTNTIKQPNVNSNYYSLLLVFPILSVVFAYSSSTVDVVLMPKYVVFSVASLVTTFLAYSASIKNPQSFKAIISNIFFKVYFIYLCLAFVSLQISCNYADGLFEWFKMFVFAASLFCISIYLFSYNKLVEIFVKTITVANLLIAIIGVVQFLVLLAKHQVTHNATYAVSATFGHKNIYAEILFITFPFAVYNLFFGTKIWKFVSCFCIIFSLFLITVLLTRAVWLATFIGFLFTISVYVFASGSNQNLISASKNYRKNLLVSISIIFIIGASIFTYSRIDSLATIKKQTISIAYFSYGSGAERLELWKKSMHVFAEHPIFGNGLSSWKIKVLKYGHNGLETQDNKTFHQRPHNDYIWILAEQGIIGLLVYLILIVIIIYLIIKLIFSAQNVQTQLFYFLCLYSYCGYLIYSFFSFPKERIEHQVVLVYMFSAIIIASSKKNNERQNNISYHFVFPILLGVGIFAIYIGYKRFGSEIHLQKAYNARANSDWQTVITEIEKAESKYFEIDPMCTPLCWYSGSAYFNLGNQAMAYSCFEKAYSLNPNHVHVLNNLATSYEINGEHSKAIEMYAKAIIISPTFIDAKLNLIATYYNSGNIKQAFDNYAAITIDTLNPKYMQMLPLIINSKLKLITDTMQCTPLKMQIVAIANTPTWSYSLYKKAIKNEIIFDRQLLTDAIYMLDKNEKKQHILYIQSIIKKFEIVEPN